MNIKRSIKLNSASIKPENTRLHVSVNKLC